VTKENELSPENNNHDYNLLAYTHFTLFFSDATLSVSLTFFIGSSRPPSKWKGSNRPPPLLNIY
jgi:hypothetical protein